MRVLVLRPEPDATRSAAALGKLGHEAVAAPLFTVRPTGDPCPDGPFDAAVITSANAVAPLIAGMPSRSRRVPLFAVGERSAAVAREAGFTQVRSADGARSDLITLAKAQLQPGGRVLLALGRDHKDDLAPRLAEAGLQPVLWTAYWADAADTLPDTARIALEAGDLDAVLHYSRRGAEIFIALARDAECWEQAARLTHLALSEDVAVPLRASHAAHVVIAAQPQESALLQILSGIKARNRQASGDNLGQQPDQRPAPDTGPLTGDSMSAGENDRGSGLTGQPSARAGRGRRQAVVIEGDVVAAPATDAAVSGPVPDQAIKAEAPVAETPPEPEIADVAAAAAPMTPAETAAVPAIRQFGALAVVGAGLLGGFLGTGLALILPRLIPSLDASTSRTTSLDQRLAQLQETAAPRQALETFETKIGTASAAAARAQTESAATAKRLSDLLAAAPSGTDAATIAPIAERAKRAEALAVSATESLAAREKLLDEAARKVNDLTARLAAVEQTAKTGGAPGAAAINATRLVLTSRIAQALESGRPFASDLKALGSAGSDKPEAARLAPLLAVADRGAASREALLSEFRRLRPALEQDTVTQSASLGDRVLKMMGSVVSIRPLGEQSGTSPLALTSRIDQGLISGDMAAAAAAWKQLPEPARRASESFGAKLAARAAAMSAVRQLEDETVAALGASK